MLQESFSRAAINDEHNQHLLHTFFGCNYDIFLQFCLILGWKRSIISILSEMSSNKTPAPLNVPMTFLPTKLINESSLSHACPRALKIYPFPWRSGNKSILFSLIPPKFSTLFLNARLFSPHLQQLHEKAVLFDCSG